MNAGLVLTTALVLASFQGFTNAAVIVLFIFSLFCAIAQSGKS